MKVKFNKQIANNNVINLQKNSISELAFLIKSQLLFEDILDILRNEIIYTNRNIEGAINIYNDENIVIVDAYEKREGISLKEAARIPNKNTAIVNFCCVSNRIPFNEEVDIINLKLKKMGFNKVSLGGSLLLERNFIVDEIRVGEAFLTGYSTIYKKYFKGCENPFTIEVEIEKEDEDIYLVKKGFLEFGGFTNCKPIAVNTDYTVFDKSTPKENSFLILKPDYYTLIKLADKKLLKWEKD